MEVHTEDAQTLLDRISDKLPSTSSTNPNINILPVPSALIDTTFSATTNLTTTVLHSSVLSFSDEYFAGATNLLTPTAPIRRPGYYVHTGAWYDGWETRRHNRAEYDWVVIKLGCVGVIEGVEVDTTHFTGNEAPAAGLDGIFAPSSSDETSTGQTKKVPTDEEISSAEFQGWEEVLPKQNCGPSTRQAWKVSGKGVEGKEWTHLRLKMYPDGGISRLRVYGKVVPPPLASAVAAASAASDSETLSALVDGKPLEDLASALNGGVATQCSDQHFGVKSNLLLPGRGKDMGDGWETARSRLPGHVDWAVVRLGLRGRTIEKIVVDTKDFRGNFPRAVKVEGWKVDDAKAALGTEAEPTGDTQGWIELVRGEKECAADKEHEFTGEDLVGGALQGQVWTHIKMTIIPDGGVKRIKVLGRRA